MFSNRETSEWFPDRPGGSPACQEGEIEICTHVFNYFKRTVLATHRRTANEDHKEI
jgi:hypothetical protein